MIHTTPFPKELARCVKCKQKQKVMMWEHWKPRFNWKQHFKCSNWKCVFGKWNVICVEQYSCQADEVFFRDGLAYFSRTMPDHILQVLPQHSPGAELACQQSWPFENILSSKKGAPELLSSWNPGKHSNFYVTAVGLLGSQMLSVVRRRRADTVGNTILKRAAGSKFRMDTSFSKNKFEHLISFFFS